VVVCDLAGALDPGVPANDITVVALVQASAYPSIDNVAVVETSTPETQLADNTATDTVIVPPVVDLAVTKTHRGSFVVGQQATYDVTVTNNGPTDDPGPITVRDTLPIGVTYSSFSGTGWSCSNSDQLVTCAYVSPLPMTAGSNSASLALTVDVLPAAYPSVTNSVTVSTVSEDVDPDNDTATDPAPVTPFVELGLTKVLSSYQDQSAVYAITVINNGPNRTAQPIVVNDQIPAGLTYVSASGVGWTCGEVSSLITCTYSPTLAVGETATFDLSTTVVAAPGDTVTNEASIANLPSTDNVSGNNRDTAEFTVDAPSSGVLPKTGAEWGATILLSLALLVVGWALVVSTRTTRSRRTS